MTGGVVIELLPPQPTSVKVIARSIMPNRMAIRRLRFLPLPASTRANTPIPLMLAQRVGAPELELGPAGATKDAVGPVVVMVRVVDTALPAGVTDLGLKLAQLVVAGNVPQLKVTVPL